MLTVKMPSKASKDNCIICDQSLPGEEREKIYAIGKCNHVICYVCSARLRVICDQFECPVCRVKLDNVIYSAVKKRSFDLYDTKEFIHNDKYGIYFENSSLEDTFHKLLRYECQKCVEQKVAFDNVDNLKHHLDRVHRLSLCELCLKHDKLFPFEYSYYDRKQLIKHRKEGEENTSHRGHPKCQLCSEPFFNIDELIAHMSREHFHCHLCHRDGSMRVYFNDYDSLRDHFKSSHYLCERGQCREERFTSVFESEIDFRIHLMSEHGPSTLSAGRSDSRHFRPIPVTGIPSTHSSNYDNRSGSSQGAHRRSNGGHRDRNMATIDPTAGLMRPSTAAAISRLARATAQAIGAPILPVRLPTNADFPSLDGSSPSASSSSVANPRPNSSGNSNAGTSSQTASSVKKNVRQGGPSTLNTLSQRVAASSPQIRGNFIRSLRLDEDDFPPLPENKPAPKAQKKTIKANSAIKSTSNNRTNKTGTSSNNSNNNKKSTNNQKKATNKKS
ncbi:E3 ubiquitin-protein ligase [Fragariocoptes setiger]|uniref:E3 ubiquitin-protein ligase n=1 Tax=Fragariocoptes setiger TaxID=1670756 RepID=A0ABQ7S7X5_9ACAR|nr:E3 ubiquitin-protein ligase [Fragariocoptes setiger]